MISTVLCCDDYKDEISYSEFIIIHESDYDTNDNFQDALSLLTIAANEGLPAPHSFVSVVGCKKITFSTTYSNVDITTGVEPDSSYAFTIYFMRFRRKTEIKITRELI